MSSVSDIVTPYDLPYQAKAALCNYVPKLRKTYNAQDLDDEHPIRLTNQAAKFDHSEERDYEFTWWVPRPGRGTNFWMPLRINPEQEDLWHDLVSEDAKAGEIRLQQHRKNWYYTSPSSTRLKNQRRTVTPRTSAYTSEKPPSSRAVPSRTVLRLTRSCVAEAERSISEKRCTRP